MSMGTSAETTPRTSTWTETFLTWRPSFTEDADRRASAPTTSPSQTITGLVRYRMTLCCLKDKTATKSFCCFGEDELNWHLKESLNAGRQVAPETYAVMKWIRSMPFVLSASFHSGDLMVSYPYDLSKHPRGQNMFSPTPDDKVNRFCESQALKVSENSHVRRR